LCKLKDFLAEIRSVFIAYSGGGHGTFLAAAEMAHRLGARHLFVETGVLDDPSFSCNPPHRCYICKRALFSRVRELASKPGLNEVIEGSNRDDLGEYCPGLRPCGGSACEVPSPWRASPRTRFSPYPGHGPSDLEQARPDLSGHPLPVWEAPHPRKTEGGGGGVGVPALSRPRTSAGQGPRCPGQNSGARRRYGPPPGTGPSSR